MPRKIVVRKNVAANGMDAKKGRTGAKRLNSDQRRPRRRAICAMHYFGQLLNCRRLEESCQRQLPSESLLDLRKKTHCQKRVPAQIEEVVAHSNRLDI